MAKTRLYKAVESGDVDRVKAALQGISPSPSNDLTKYLLLASERGYLETVKELLKAGADPRGRNRDNHSALKAALENNHFDVVKELLRTGAARANEACLALLFACVDNYLETDGERIAKRKIGLQCPIVRWIQCHTRCFDFWPCANCKRVAKSRR